MATSCLLSLSTIALNFGHLESLSARINADGRAIVGRRAVRDSELINRNSDRLTHTSTKLQPQESTS